jgi:hypothetical protein
MARKLVSLWIIDDRICKNITLVSFISVNLILLSFFRKKLCDAIKIESRSKMKKSMDDIFSYADCSWSKRSSLQEGKNRKSSSIVEKGSRGGLPSSTPYSTCFLQISRVTPAEEIEDLDRSPSSSSATSSSSSSSARYVY